MSLRGTCALVVPALVAGALTLPALAGQSPVPQPLISAPGIAVTATADGGLTTSATVQGALTAVRRHADTRAWLTGVAAAVQAASGSRPGPAPLLWADPEDVEVELPPVEGFFDFALAGPGGDLDGDGLDDVLALRGDADDLTLQARRGTDGELLWSAGLADGGGALAYPLGLDLTGDGVDDLISHVVTGTEEVVIGDGAEQSTYRYTADLVHAITVHSGRDGRPVWDREVEASIDESATSRTGPGGVTYDVEYSLTSVALAVLPLLSDDLTGDGLSDVVLEEIDLDVAATASGAGAVVAFAEAFEVALRSRTRVEALRGTDGEASLRLESEQQPAIAVAVPVGDVAGSPAGDLAWSTQPVPDVSAVCAGAVLAGTCLGGPSEPGPVEVALVDGATGLPAWTTTAEGFAPFTFPLGVDADRDGAHDLALLVETADGGRLVVLSGRDGRALWQVDGQQPFPLAVAPDAAGRLVAVVVDLVVEFSHDLAGPTSTTARTVVSRHDAADGAVLSTRTRESTASAQPGPDGTSGFAAVVVAATPDGDGDGRPELVTSTIVEAAGADEDGRSSSRDTSSDARVEDLTSGHELLVETADDARLLLPLGDLDGDGLLDLERDVFGDDPFASAQVNAFRMVDGEQLWQFTGSLFDAPYPAGDHDGRPGSELLQMSGADGPTPQVASLGGADLSERWRAAARG
jgi:hypothetical protein